jgi:DNA-binding NtrC family response regulator
VPPHKTTGDTQNPRSERLEYTRTAESLGMSRNTLYRKIKKHEIEQSQLLNQTDKFS